MGYWTRSPARVVAVLLTVGCGDDSTPPESPLVLAKAATASGDAQTGPTNSLLPNALRVVVTRDGAPVSGITVSWTTASGGSMTPTSDQTSSDGTSSSTWTLGTTPGAQTAAASVQDANGSPASFTATATTTSGPVIQVISANSSGDPNRFSPSSITVDLGSTVVWEWVDDAAGHNVIPDEGDIPVPSGLLVTGPNTYQYTFNQVGVFHYHCQAHGAAGGIGMSGTVTVVNAGP